MGPGYRRDSTGGNRENGEGASNKYLPLFSPVWSWSSIERSAPAERWRIAHFVVVMSNTADGLAQNLK
jgi:hypothetical protein